MSKTGVHRNNISKSLLMQVVILEILSLGFGYIFILFYEKVQNFLKKLLLNNLNVTCLLVTMNYE